MTNGELDEEGEALNRFRTLHVAGVILFASQLAANSPPIRQFHDTQIPLIFVDPIIKPPKESVCVDRATGMKEAVLHLFELGHRHIATVGLSGEGSYTRSRLKGVNAAYEERGLDASKFLKRIEMPLSEDSHYELGRKSAEILWNHAARPTAVLALNDRVAIGLISGLRALGVRVPEDVSVVGYDNMEVGLFVRPQLTTIDAQPDELVK